MGCRSSILVFCRLRRWRPMLSLLHCRAMTDTPKYTTQLQAGLGLLPETQKLLAIWEPGMTGQDLLKAALASGEFPNVTARRLRNVVLEAFSPRYLLDDAAPARLLKAISASRFEGRFPFALLPVHLPREPDPRRFRARGLLGPLLGRREFGLEGRFSKFRQIGRIRRTDDRPMVRDNGQTGRQLPARGAARTSAFWGR